MGYNTKNYTEQGGNVTHFGGKVIFENGCEVEGFPSQPVDLPPATADTLGGVKVGNGLSVMPDGTLSADGITPAESQADSIADTVEALKTDLNTLLAKLKAAGLMAADGE